MSFFNEDHHFGYLCLYAWDGTNDKRWWNHLVRFDPWTNDLPVGTVLLGETRESRPWIAYAQIIGRRPQWMMRSFGRVSHLLKKMRRQGQYEAYPDLGHLTRDERLDQFEGLYLYRGIRKILSDLKGQIGSVSAINSNTCTGYWIWRDNRLNSLPKEEDLSLHVGAVVVRRPIDGCENWDCDTGVVLPRGEIWWYSKSVVTGDTFETENVSLTQAKRVAADMTQLVREARKC